MYLYILLIIILVLLLCNQNKVREGFNVKGNIVEYKGSQYRTLSGLSPTARQWITETGISNPLGINGQPAKKPDSAWGWRMPPGWKLAPFNKESWEVARKFPWGTGFMVVGDDQTGLGSPLGNTGGGVAVWTALAGRDRGIRRASQRVAGNLNIDTRWSAFWKWWRSAARGNMYNNKRKRGKNKVYRRGKRVVWVGRKNFVDSYVTRDGGELGEWSWPRVRHRLSGGGVWFYSIGSIGNPYVSAMGAILLIKGGKKPKPKIGLKKCPGVWHDLKSQLGYYDIKKHANPEQVCLAKCREDSNCKAAQVQFGKLPKVKVKSAGVHH